jgi:3-oxoacyl-[acyl-carrier-protein] synthase II
MYITAAACISYQNSFNNKGFHATVKPLTKESEPINPDYKTYIPPLTRRRMSDAVKMAIACSLNCLDEGKIKIPQGIIVGCGLGCGYQTKKFLDIIIEAEGGVLSPTSFSLSTANTIAGQISLMIGTQGYNTTYTQNSLSFEHGLIDSVLCIEEGLENILVGGVDEATDRLYNFSAKLEVLNAKPSIGSAFFILSSQTKNQTPISLKDVAVFGLTSNIVNDFMAFLETNNIESNSIDLILYSSSNRNSENEILSFFGDDRCKDFTKWSGIYFTNSAFAMAFAVDKLRSIESGYKKYNILIINNLIPENLGLILLSN